MAFKFPMDLDSTLFKHFLTKDGIVLDILEAKTNY